MRLEWLLHPLTNYAFLVAGIGLCLWLCFHCQRGLAAVKQRSRSDRDIYDLRIGSLTFEIAKLRQRLQEAEEQVAVACAPAAPKAGMNLTRRSQVLRMHRRGERPEQIAAALQVPNSEVELLLKLHLAELECA
jgi:hypothetical protein